MRKQHKSSRFDDYPVHSMPELVTPYFRKSMNMLETAENIQIEKTINEYLLEKGVYQIELRDEINDKITKKLSLQYNPSKKMSLLTVESGNNRPSFNLGSNKLFMRRKISSITVKNDSK